MSTTGLEVFDKTVQATNLWLEEINSTIGPDRAVFQVLNHFLDPDQIADVRGALSKPARRLRPENAAELHDETERSFERTEP